MVEGAHKKTNCFVCLLGEGVIYFLKNVPFCPRVK